MYACEEAVLSLAKPFEQSNQSFKLQMLHLIDSPSLW